MVLAVSSRRHRFLTAWFVAILILAAFPFVMPTAAAAPTVSTPSVEIFVGGIKSTGADTALLTTGSQFEVRVSATVTTAAPGCTVGNTQPGNPSVRLDLANFSSTYTGIQQMSSANTSVTGAGPWTIQGTQVFTVGPSPTGKDNATIPITANVSATCPNGATFADMGFTNGTSSDKVYLDNTPPKALVDGVTVTRATGSTGGIGSGYVVTIPGPIGDAAKLVFSLYELEFTNASRTYLATTGIPGQFTGNLEPTGKDSPRVWVEGTDAHGQAYNRTIVLTGFDAKAPNAISGAYSASSQSDGSMHISYSPPAPGTDTGLVVNISRGGTLLKSVVCPSADCSLVTAGDPRVYKVTGYTFTPNVIYDFTLAAQDSVGNVGPTTAPKSEHAKPILTGVLEAAITGTGGTGSTVTLTAKSLHSNVTGVDINVGQFTGSSTIITLTQGQSTSFTVNAQPGFPAPQVFANLTGANGDKAVLVPTDPSGTPLTASTFDTKAPDQAAISQIVPKRGGHVELTIAPPAESDVTSYIVAITKTSGGTTTTLTFTAPPLLLNVTSANFTTLGVSYDFTVTPVDARGNVGTVSAVKSTIPALDPLSITFSPKPSGFIPAWPTFTGEWSASSSLTAGQGAIKIYIQNATGKYWDGSGSSSASFVTAPTGFAVDNSAGSSGTWTSDIFAPASTPYGERIRDVPYGQYTVTIEITTGSSGTVSNAHILIFDGVAPTLGTPTIANPAVSNVAIVQQGTTEVVVNLAISDEHSKPRNVSFQLRSTGTGTPPAAGINGNIISIDCPSVSCTSAFVTGANFTGTALFTLNGVAIGDYRLSATVWDQAGTATGPSLLATTLRVVPRAVIAQTSETPFAYPDGIALRAYAALEAKSSVQPLNNNCPLDTCRVTSLEIRARPYTGTGSDGEGTIIANVSIPISGPDTSYSTTGPRYYNYTPASRINATAFNPALDHDNLQLLATTWVKRADGSFASSPMTWVRVGTGIAPPSTLNINKPASEWQVEMPGTAGNTKFNVTFEQSNLVGVPKLNYSIRNLATGMYVDVSASSGAVTSTTPANVIVNVTNTGGGASTVQPGGPLYNWTWSNNATIPPGEYVLNVTMTAATGGFLKGVERHFAVQSAAPVIRLLSAESQIYDDRYVGRPFNVSLEVDTGYANLSQSGVTAVLETGVVNAPYLQNGAGGFSAAMTSFYELANKSTTRVNYTVTLPSSANDGTRFDLRFNVTTDSFLVCGCALANSTYFQTIIFDNAPPSGVVDLLNTNATGRNLADQLRIIGFAEDTGSGISAVEVRLVNLSEGTTFKWDLDSAGRFHTSTTLDSWLSSNLQRPAASTSGDYFRNVYVTRTSPTSTLYQWVINQTDRAHFDVNGNLLAAAGKFDPIPLDRFSTYRLDVRVTDNVGQVSATQSFEVRFDPDGPTLANATNRPGGLWGPTTVDWHSTPYNSQTKSATDIFTTNVSDNHCVKTVMLKGRAPSGAIVSADFERPTGYVCNQQTGKGNEVNNWRIDLAKNTQMTNEVGVYNYWVEAVDFAGRNTSVAQQFRSFNVNVTDTFAAKVTFEHFTPQFGQVGGSTTLFFEVEENKGLDKIDIYYMHRVNGTVTNTYTPVAPRADPAKPPAANGTGGYMLDTAEDLKLDLEVGEYVFDIRPIDWDYTGCKSTAERATGCAHLGQRIILQIVSDAAPSLIREAPATGTAYVNASPEFRFRVIDPSVEASGITLQAGDSATNLTDVTPTLEALMSGANRTGYRVTYKPDLAGAENYTLRLRATDTTGLAAVETYTFAVDSVAPVVTLNITGNRTGPDGLDYAVDATRIEITGVDALSGMGGITYSENNGTARTYSQPVIPDGADGAYELKWTARDNASNAASGFVHLRMDKTGPSITSSNDPKNGTIVKVTASDAGVGINESTLIIRYAFGNASIFANATFTKESGNLYSVTLPKVLNEEGTRYYVEAFDLFGNKGNLFSVASPKVIAKFGAPGDNETIDLPPVVTITSPVNNAVANGTVELTWTATDPEDAPLTVTIALREPTGPGRVLVESGENTGAYTVNVSGFEPGTYTLIVTAIDSTNQGQAEVAFRIPSVTTPPPPADPVKVVRALPTNIKSGDQLTFAVQLGANNGSAVQSASFKVVRDGKVVSNGALVPLATGYSGAFAADDAGQYSVLVSATYMDGSTLDDERAATFEVQQAEVTSSGLLPTSLILLLVLGMLTVGLAAYAAFVRWGK